MKTQKSQNKEPKPTWEEWQASKDSICCSMPTCDHQEPPDHIVEKLKAHKAEAAAKATDRGGPEPYEI